MEYTLQFLKLCHYEARRILFVMGITAVTILVFQSLTLSYGNVFLFLFPVGNAPTLQTKSFPIGNSYPESVMVGSFSLLNASDLTESSMVIGMVNNEASNIEEETVLSNEKQGDRNSKNDFESDKDGDLDNVLELDEDTNLDNEFFSEKAADLDSNSAMEDVENSENSSLLEKDREPEHDLLLEKTADLDGNSAMANVKNSEIGSLLEKDREPEHGLPVEKIAGLDSNSAMANVKNSENGSLLQKVRESEHGLPVEEIAGLDGNSAMVNVKNSENGSLLEKDRVPEHGLPLEKVTKSDNVFLLENDKKADTGLELEKIQGSDAGLASSISLSPVTSSINISLLRNSGTSSNASIVSVSSNQSLVGQQATEIPSNNETFQLLQSGPATSNNNSTMTSNSVRKKMRCDMPPKSVTSMSEMNHLLLRRHASLRSIRPQRPSVRDQEIVSAKTQIMNAPIVKNDRELYTPLFRNVSMFKRSYELMERILKVYIYREGEKPIFHQPILKGLYASEGWFMKLMEGNKKFIVKDPRKAHLFYMPFSSRMLEYTLYVRNSHNRTNLAKYLKTYAEIIAAKYPFWNRTGGADHFFVACHDWAPYETRHHMERCIKAMCNSDVTGGFKIGKDVSLPETYVRSARNPLRDLGGKPPSERPVLAFFAGNLHGYLRRILLHYWENKDPSMKIFGPMPPGVASKMNYIQHMKTSKYCICAKGYEVNSPRVVEAIFYECVPVIISDNFVPPFFEVLDWEAFSVFVPEKDIPNLKDILLSIPEERYLAMQLMVKKAQKHFLWHSKPMKYDLFYMTLHSIWYNRVFQIRPK